VLFSEEVEVLKREVACKDYEINVLKSEFEKVKQEKEGIEFKIDKFDNASKDLDKLLGSQITDKSKKGLGYNVVPPPHPLIYNRPKKLDLSYSGLDEFKDPEFKSYGFEDKQVSEDTSNFVESLLNVDKEIIFLDKKIEIVKPKNHKKTVKKSVRYAEMVNYNYTTNKTYPNAQRNMVPRAVLMKTGSQLFNTDRTVNTARPKSIVFSATSMSRFSKSAQLNVRGPYQSKIVLSNKRFTQTNNTTKAKAVNTARPKAVNTARPHSTVVNAVRFNQANAVKASACWGKPLMDDKGFVDNGCSRHMTGNIAYLSNFKEFDGGYVTFQGRKDNMYSFDMKNIVPKESLTCLVAKATSDESMLWHRRLGHINFKNINMLVKDSIIRGLPIKHFENDQTYVACLKGKQHRASCQSKVLNPITKPLFMLHMDLFGTTFVSSLMHKKNYLVVTDDYNRFTWVFFLASKDETSEILKKFIKEIENLADKKVKIIKCDNGIEFKNKVMDDFCREKDIKREYSVARTP
ncbi:putative ribonuclease H-like domain-containing protein, partial [Tanacetum coccineum]